MCFHMLGDAFDSLLNGFAGLFALIIKKQRDPLNILLVHIVSLYSFRTLSGQLAGYGEWTNFFGFYQNALSSGFDLQEAGLVRLIALLEQDFIKFVHQVVQFLKDSRLPFPAK